MLRVFKEMGCLFYLGESTKLTSRVWLFPHVRILAGKRKGRFLTQSVSWTKAQALVFDLVIGPQGHETSAAASPPVGLRADVDELEQKLSGLKNALTRVLKDRSSNSPGELLRKRLVEARFCDQELQEWLLDLLSKTENGQTELQKNKGKELQSRLAEQGEKMARLREEAMNLRRERDQLEAELMETKLLVDGRVDMDFNRLDRGMLPVNQVLIMDVPFQFPIASVAALRKGSVSGRVLHLDAALRKGSVSGRVLCKPREYKLVHSIHSADIQSGAKRQQVSLGQGLVTCRSCKKVTYFSLTTEDGTLGRRK
jgi:hypothetical protein